MLARGHRNVECCVKRLKSAKHQECERRFTGQCSGEDDAGGDMGPRRKEEKMATILRKGSLVLLLSLSAGGAVWGAAPDLTPAAPTAPPSVVTQHRVEVSWSVENQGNGEAQAAWYDQLYLSEDDVLDGGDRVLDTFYRSEAVASGGSYTPIRPVTIPTVPAGTYYLIVRTDLYDHLYEADETNNLASREIYVSAIEGFRIVAIAPAASGRLCIDFTNDAGRMYGLEHRDSMEQGDWATEQFFLTEDGIEPYSEILGTGDVLTIYVEPTDSRNFYRMAGQ
jgi:hypothetical protein